MCFYNKLINLPGAMYHTQCWHILISQTSNMNLINTILLLVHFLITSENEFYVFVLCACLMSMYFYDISFVYL